MARSCCDSSTLRRNRALFNSTNVVLALSNSVSSSRLRSAKRAGKVRRDFGGNRRLIYMRIELPAESRAPRRRLPMT